MTKPANSPGRVNTRRIRALERIEAQLASGVKRAKRSHDFHRRFEPLTAADGNRLSREADALALTIKPEAAARDIRTKKTPKETWSADRRARRSGKIDR